MRPERSAMPSNDSLSDGNCIQQCLDGDSEAFRTLVMRYQNPLLAFARGRVPHEADEVAQESFVRAFTQLRSLKNPASLFPWLIGIADRVIKESRRSDARYQSAITRLAALQPADRRPSGEGDDLELDRAVAGLPEPYRQIVLLRYYGELSCVQIGDRLDVPVGTVTKRLSRAYAMLREALIPQTAASERTCHELH
jgi:RNA polymerase sigma-70 factor (ECF subfamily)